MPLTKMGIPTAVDDLVHTSPPAQCWKRLVIDRARTILISSVLLTGLENWFEKS